MPYNPPTSSSVRRREVHATASGLGGGHQLGKRFHSSFSIPPESPISTMSHLSTSSPMNDKHSKFRSHPLPPTSSTPMTPLPPFPFPPSSNAINAPKKDKSTNQIQRFSFSSSPKVHSTKVTALGNKVAVEKDDNTSDHIDQKDKSSDNQQGNDDEFAFSKLHNMWSQRDKSNFVKVSPPTATAPIQLKSRSPERLRLMRQHLNNKNVSIVQNRYDEYASSNSRKIMKDKFQFSDDFTQKQPSSKEEKPMFNVDSSFDDETNDLLFRTNSNELPFGQTFDKKQNINARKSYIAKVIKGNFFENQDHDRSFTSTGSDLVPRKLIDFSSSTSMNEEKAKDSKIDQNETHKNHGNSIDAHLNLRVSSTFDPFNDALTNGNLDDSASWQELSFASLGNFIQSNDDFPEKSSKNNNSVDQTFEPTLIDPTSIEEDLDDIWFPSDIEEREFIPQHKDKNNTTASTSITSFDPFDESSMLSNDNDGERSNKSSSNWHEMSFSTISSGLNGSYEASKPVMDNECELSNAIDNRMTNVSGTSAMQQDSFRHTLHTRRTNNEDYISAPVVDPYDDFDSMSTANSEMTQRITNKKFNDLYSKCMNKIEQHDEKYTIENQVDNMNDTGAFDCTTDDNFSDIADSAFGIGYKIKDTKPVDRSITLRSLAIQQGFLNNSGTVGKRVYYSNQTAIDNIDNVDDNNNEGSETDNYSTDILTPSLDCIPTSLYPKAMSDSGTDVFDGLSSVAGPSTTFSPSLTNAFFENNLPLNNDDTSELVTNSVETKNQFSKVHDEPIDTQSSSDTHTHKVDDEDNVSRATQLSTSSNNIDTKSSSSTKDEDQTQSSSPNSVSQISHEDVKTEVNTKDQIINNNVEKKRFRRYLSIFSAKAKYWRKFKAVRKGVNRHEHDEYQTMGTGISLPPSPDVSSIDADNIVDVEHESVQTSPESRSPILSQKKEPTVQRDIIENIVTDTATDTDTDISNLDSELIRNIKSKVGWIPSMIRHYNQRKGDALNNGGINLSLSTNHQIPLINDCLLSGIRVLQLDCNDSFGSVLTDPSMLIVHKSINDRQDKDTSNITKLRAFLESTSTTHEELDSDKTKWGMFEEAVATHERVLSMMSVSFRQVM